MGVETVWPKGMADVGSHMGELYGQSGGFRAAASIRLSSDQRGFSG